MALITGTAANDTMTGAGLSAGVTTDSVGINSSTDTIIGSAGNDVIDGEGGFANWLDYSALPGAITLTFSDWDSGSVVKASGTDSYLNIQRFLGTAGSDLLTGWPGSFNVGEFVGDRSLWLRGNAGNDTINGQSLNTIAADYANSPGAITANLADGTAQDGWGGTDTLLGVRRIQLSAFADNVTGSAFADIFVLTSPGGGKVLNAGGGSDGANQIWNGSATAAMIDLGIVPSGGGGHAGSVTVAGRIADSISNFTIAVGGTAADTLLGSLGHDTLAGEAGNDLLIGRAGFDVVDYTRKTISPRLDFGVTVNLNSGIATDNWQNTDTLVDIESVIGTSLADSLTGNGKLGWWQRSILVGNGGADQYFGAGLGFVAVDFSAGPSRSITMTGFGDFASLRLNSINAIIGSAFGDAINGSLVSEWHSGGGGDDVMSGQGGNDRLLGDGGNDTLAGDMGDDVLTGGAGLDVMTGGSGADRYVFTLGAGESTRAALDTIQGFDTTQGDKVDFLGGTVWFNGSTGTALAALTADVALPVSNQPAGLGGLNAWLIPSTQANNAWLVVDENGDNTLQAGEFAVLLRNDTVNGEALNTSGVVAGGAGTVTRRGTADADVIFASSMPGAFSGIQGLAGDDTIYGSAGPDAMAGGTGNDVYVMRHFESVVTELEGEGYDVVWVGQSLAQLTGHFEEIRLFGAATDVRGGDTAEQIVANAAQASSLWGNGGDDVLWGTALADTLDGGDGNDILRSGGGNDELIGGSGDDNIVVNATGATIIEYANNGHDTAWIAVNGYTLSANIEVARLAANGAVRLTGSSTGENLVANQGASSTLIGNGGNDVLWGSGFADSLNGGEGDDIMRGQGGNDSLVGGEGNDQYVLFSAAGTVTETSGNGYDILYFAGSGSFTSSQSLEEVRLVDQATGFVYTGLDTTGKLLVGNSSGLASTITAGRGNDIVYGTAAADTLAGGLGNDTLYGEGGADVILVDVSNWGIDLVAGLGSGAKIQFAPGSGITAFGQLAVNAAGGNTVITAGGNSIMVFGSMLSQSDFIFG